MRNDMPNAVRQKKQYRKVQQGSEMLNFLGFKTCCWGGMVLNSPRSATATILQHRFFMSQNVQGVVILSHLQVEFLS